MSGSLLTRRDGALFIEDVAASALAREHDTPLYVYGRTHLVERARRFEAAFGSADHITAYAIKANMNLAVVKTLLEAGCGVDVTSRGELERALVAGADPHKIIYSGIGKRAHEIDRALQVGVRMLNVESLDELALVDARAGELGVSAPVGFRLNPDVDAHTHPKIATGLRSSKFGIPIEEAAGAYAHAKSLAHVRVVGAACHIVQAAAQIKRSLRETVDDDTRES